MTPGLRNLTAFTRSSLLICALSATLMAMSGCSGGSGGQGDVATDTDANGDLDVENGFDDHTIPAIGTEQDFFDLAIEGSSRYATKFIITDFEGEPRMRYMDSHFYTLHDEWYWFRLLNGYPVRGVDTPPVVGMSFADVQAIYSWAESIQGELPLDLRWVGDGRLYSPEFYDLSLGDPRSFGVGTIIHVPARTGLEDRPPFWLFELEYSDHVTHPMLVTYFERLQATLPEDIANQLLWVVRSPHQDALAEDMEQQKLQYWDRVVRWSDIIVPGDVEVYSEGLTAGRLRVVKSGEPGLQASRETDILVSEEVPDWLPPASGLVTGRPQTPLAHVNVLARNRGIPNAYLGGVVDDPEIDQLARVRAPVIVRAVAPDQLDIVAMSEQEYSTWRGMGELDPISVPPVDPETLDYSLDLASLDAANLTQADLDSLRPIIGGKASGFLGLAAPGVVTMPDKPMVITVRAYMEHMVTLAPALNAMLADLDFKTSARARFLLLEGAEDYEHRYQSEDDKEFEVDFYLRHPAGTWLGDILRADGFKKYLRQKPMNPDTLQQLMAALQAQYGDYSNRQGLRFRSSSSVEDIEGFNGAGLYDSNTGFLVPSAQAPDDRKKTVEWAIKKTWSSYWGFEAFEERRLEKVNHLSGGMAVLVHARFDDDKELSNGVFTFTILPDNYDDAMIMDLNVQDGAESVTNPTPGLDALPEVNRVVLTRGDDTPSVQRVASSNLVPSGTRILSDQELLAVFEQARAVTERWLERQNESRGPARAASTLTLDFEFREMAEGWPAIYLGATFPERIVIKQSRSLEPGLRRIPDTMINLPFPVDILGRARRGVRYECNSDVFTLITVDSTTDPIMYPDVGYAQAPFTSFVSLTFNAAVAEMSLAEGDRAVLEHPAFDASHPGMEEGGPWTLALDIPDGDVVSHLELNASGEYRISNDLGARSGTYSCTNDVLLTTPQDFLATLLED